MHNSTVEMVGDVSLLFLPIAGDMFDSFFFHLPHRRKRSLGVGVEKTSLAVVWVIRGLSLRPIYDVMIFSDVNKEIGAG
jgi:hypothetical protein